MSAHDLYPSESLHSKAAMMLAHSLRRQHFAHMPGAAVASWLSLEAAQWARFADYWERLTVDHHMADGGTYRFRRYGAFELELPKPLRLLPHAAYEQPSYINPLNGGVKRSFDPLERGFADSPVLTRFLASLASVLDAVEGRPGRWNVRLHPYRIRADLGAEGRPTPEGLHRDGVDYIVTMMIRRHNVDGGETTMTDEYRHTVWRYTLTTPMEFIVANDHRTMHAVTPITAAAAAPSGDESYRDVLVVAYTKEST